MAGWTCNDAELIEWDGTIKADRLIGDGTNISGVIPVGTIIMFGGATAPTGWLLCNNQSLSTTGTYAALFAVIGYTFGGTGANFSVPDMQGIFPRGAGYNNILTKAAGGTFNATLGTYYNDQFQDHTHRLYGSQTAGTGFGGVRNDGVQSQVLNDDNVLIAHGGAGSPRTGTETNPANLGLTFIIKY